MRCTDLDAAIGMYVDQFGFRLDMIRPADSPRIALLSGDRIFLRLQVDDAVRAEPKDHAPTGFSIRHADRANQWITGRAGMQYRDLVAQRLGGQLIASHIRIPDGGAVPDYVHYHKVGFQMIYCKHGWVRVVYEDQGPPFVMQAGDCVLQPPTIRHRVLEASLGLEVIEVSCPAEHETWRDHVLELPTNTHRPERLFAGQRFVRHVARESVWQESSHCGFEIRDTEIAAATRGLAGVRVLRASQPGCSTRDISPAHLLAGSLVFLYVLKGQLRLRHPEGEQILEKDDACVIADGNSPNLESNATCEVLEVALPALAPTN